MYSVFYGMVMASFVFHCVFCIKMHVYACVYEDWQVLYLSTLCVDPSIKVPLNPIKYLSQWLNARLLLWNFLTGFVAGAKPILHCWPKKYHDGIIIITDRTDAVDATILK